MAGRDTPDYVLESNIRLRKAFEDLSRVKAEHEPLMSAAQDQLGISQTAIEAAWAEIEKASQAATEATNRWFAERDAT